MRSLITILIFFIVFQSNGQAIYDTIAWDFNILNVNDGFSAGLSHDLEIDAKGYLWAATYHGLDRYDGYGVKRYTHDPNDSLSLPANHVICLLADSRNWLWVVANNKGTYLLMEETNTFHKVSNTVYKWLEEDLQGNVWGKSGEFSWEIIEVDSTKGKHQDFTISPCTSYFDGFAPNEKIPIMTLTDNSEMWWVLRDTLYAYHLNYKTKAANLKFKINVEREKFGFDYGHTALCKDPTSESMWLFAENVYYNVDKKTGEVLSEYYYPLGLFGDKRRNSVANLGIDYRGRIFLNIDDRGLVIFDPRDNRFSLLVDRDKNAPRLNVYGGNLTEDQHHNLFFSTAGYGIYKHTRNRDIFNHFVVGDNVGSSISKFSIEDGDKIVLYSLGRRFTYDLKSKDVIHKQVFSKHPDFDPSYKLSELIPESEDRFWLSYRKMGHLSLSPIVNEKPKFPFQIDIPYDTVEYIKHAILGFQDASTLWTIFYPNQNLQSNKKNQFRLTRTNVADNTLTHYDIDVDSSFVPFTSFKDIFFASKNSLWIPTTSMGILRFDITTETFKHIYFGENSEYSLSSNSIYCFRPDPAYPDSILWIGTGNGLNKYTYAKDQFESFTTEDGLPNNVVYGILTDAHNNLWLSTNFGLCNFNPTTKSTYNFTQEDGLQHNEFNSQSYYQDDEGTFYFGGMGGLTYFDPEAFYENSAPSSVVINQLKIDNKPINFKRNQDEDEKETYRINQPIEQTKKIEFNYKQLMITFGFACLDLSKPEYNEFRYKMEGFNDDWIEAGVSHEATFTQLPAGTYTFKVQGINASNVWNRKGAELIVVMHGPWWKSWWFFFLCLLAIAGIIYLTYRYHLKQNEKIFQLRNKISTDLHDEIGSTLSSIALFGSVAETTLETDLSHSKKMLSRINARTTEAMESINDIVWAINSNNDQLKALLKRMRSYIFQLSDASNVEVYFTSDDDITDMKISMAQRKNIYLIYKEAVINAFKYAQCDTIEVQLSKTPSGLQLMVKDNGVGFNTQDALDDFSMGGNGIKNMQLRTDELKGKLIVTSAKGEGTTVTFTWKPSSKVV
ncbi:MAG: triple tyrosine motif-containing protein [Saprospiraceae bacterium]|nr:triple tyrosine motif-containing protein [Saprospiraceae bacterium]